MSEPSSIHDPAMAEYVIELIASGLTVEEIDRRPDTPSRDAIWRKARMDSDFHAKLDRAREFQQDVHVDQMIDLARTATPENWQQRRLLIQTIQWAAAKHASRKYGDKQDININVTHGLADRLNAAISRLSGVPVTIDVQAEPETTQQRS